jgi:hypothetical protein
MSPLNLKKLKFSSKSDPKPKKAPEKFTKKHEEHVQKLYQESYKDRKRIYHVSFFRGIFFGLGSVIGGTIIIAIVIWLFSFLVDLPGIGNFFRELIETINSR